MKKLISIMMGVAIILFMNQPIIAAENEKSLEEQMKEWEEAGIDMNHTAVIERILSYIENLESNTFSSLHIDREGNPLGTIVLSFTEEPNSQMKRGIEALAEEPSEVLFRIVNFTEQELLDKQNEINVAVFEEHRLEKEGITVTHTSTDIINNIVEVGILPYNKNTIKSITDLFGEEMVRVVTGVNAEPLDEESQEVEKKGFFAKLIDFFIGLFK